MNKSLGLNDNLFTRQTGRLSAGNRSSGSSRAMPDVSGHRTASRQCCWLHGPPAGATVERSPLRVSVEQVFEDTDSLLDKNPASRVKLRSALDGERHVKPSDGGGRRRTWCCRRSTCRRSRCGWRIGSRWRKGWRVGGRWCKSWRVGGRWRKVGDGVRVGVLTGVGAEGSNTRTSTRWIHSSPSLTLFSLREFDLEVDSLGQAVGEAGIVQPEGHLAELVGVGLLDPWIDSALRRGILRTAKRVVL